ncbi:MAG: peptidoglycan editing factor PgeF [Firmicutes bacterium]|nr:peptidoglycan editing factor PgeF [Bacillota bacterium]
MNLHFSNSETIFNIHTDGIPYLSVDLLDRLGVPNLYSTRFLSYEAEHGRGTQGLRVVVMNGEDLEEAAPVVFGNRDRLARQMGASIRQECVTDQMHTNHVYLVRPEDLGPILRQDKPKERRSVDGVITDLPGAVLTAFGGDCPPVYLADPVRRAIGLVHAGWRGTLGRIPAVAIQRMREEFGSAAEDLYAAIGPGICQECYEMGEEVREQFADQWGEPAAERIFRRFPAFAKDGSEIPGGKFHLDLMEANRMTLLAAGVRPERIAVSNVCTKCNADVFYSYRAHRMENEQAAMLVNRWDL